MYAEFMGGGTDLRVRSFFFGDSLAFSGPFCEQPGQPHLGRAHPFSLGGYRLLLEGVFLRIALGQVSPFLCFFFSHSQRGEVHSKWNAPF